MKMHKTCLVGIVCLSFILISACGLKEDAPPSSSPAESTGTERQGQSGKDTPLSGENEQGKESPGGGQSQEELEKSLAAYREEREKMTGVKMGDGVSGHGAPNMEDYGLDIGGSDDFPRFDSRELNEAYEAAEKYAVQTLGIKAETKSPVYPCVDPRIYAIYEAEDKGVANGYAADNIFVCEYYDNGTWQYLILVREAKGEPWRVIHHGGGYQND